MVSNENIDREPVELEDVLEDQLDESDLGTSDTEIPVLHEVIDTAQISTSDNHVPMHSINEFPMEVIDSLLDTLDQRLSKELTSIVKILKNKVKANIMDDLRRQLNAVSEKFANAETPK